MHSLNRNHRDYLLRATESMLAAWLHPILAFLCLELGSHKNHSDMETFPRGHFVKQCYFCWQNSRCFVLVNLLQFVIYLTQMPGINKEKKIIIFAEMSCLLEESWSC